MLRRTLLSVVVGLGALAGTASAAGTPTGKILFRNYSSQTVTVGSAGVDNDLVMVPRRGRALFRGAELFADYAFGIDATGDGIAERAFTVNLNGNRKATVTVGDFGLAGLLDGP